MELTESLEHGQFGSIGHLEQLIKNGENLDVEIAQLAELKNVRCLEPLWACPHCAISGSEPAALGLGDRSKVEVGSDEY